MNKNNHASCFRLQASGLNFKLVACGVQLAVLLISGCATTPYVAPVKPQGIPGIYHKVEPGQTLWRISKTYNIDLDELARINRIADASSIEKGQLIFIPGQKKQEYIPPKASSDDFAWPVRGRVIAGFGQTSGNMLNKGLNIKPYDDTKVTASRSGKVVFYADNFGNYGKTVILEHSDGFSTVYARNAEIFVRVGDYVQQGSVIARCGWAGRNREIYLHFEIRKGHIAQNPYFYLSS